MLHLHKILDCPVTSWGSCLSLLPKDPSQICFFDIETTGLSAKISQCYLIGAAAVEQIPLYFINGLPMITTAKRKFFFPFARI